jgi:hypothetical protein
MKHQFKLGARAMRLGLCTTVLGAALAAQTAHAVVIAVDFSANALSTVPFSTAGVYINVVTGAASASFASGYDINPYFSGTTSPPAGFRLFTSSTTLPAPDGRSSGVLGGATATVLSVGSVVGSAGTFASGVSNANAATPGTNYYGFRFINEGTATINYGYIIIAQAATVPAAGSVKVLGYAYENTGLAITVAAIPEPSTTFLMLGGLLAAGAFRWRQTAGRRDRA